jgi:hypothetical protein
MQSVGVARIDAERLATGHLRTGEIAAAVVLKRRLQKIGSGNGHVSSQRSCERGSEVRRADALELKPQSHIICIGVAASGE